MVFESTKTCTRFYGFGKRGKGKRGWEMILGEGTNLEGSKVVKTKSVWTRSKVVSSVGSKGGVEDGVRVGREVEM